MTTTLTRREKLQQLDDLIKDAIARRQAAKEALATAEEHAQAVSAFVNGPNFSAHEARLNPTMLADAVEAQQHARYVAASANDRAQTLTDYRREIEAEK